jgi:uncharacterized protein
MPSAFVRCYGPLNDFLPPAKRQTTRQWAFAEGASIKDLVESLGVPHTEIEYLLVDGRPVAFSYGVRAGDRVAVYPRFRTLDPGAAPGLGPPAQPEPRFVADVHLGRLAAYLRLAGFDVAYRNDYDDSELVAISVSQDRTILTRDVGVLKHGAVKRGSFVRETHPGRQLVEVLRRFDLVPLAAPFTRCIRCNGALVATATSDVAPVLPPRTRQYFDEFSRCAACGRVYWRGSHHERMRAFLQAAFEEVQKR